MKFERGKEPKAAMELGNIAKPIHVHGLYTTDENFPSAARMSKDSANLTHEAIRSTLHWIENNPWHEDTLELEFVLASFQVGVPTGESEFGAHGWHNIRFNLHPLHEYQGMYLEYEGTKYHIPHIS